jgi:hypothetical protein
VYAETRAPEGSSASAATEATSRLRRARCDIGKSGSADDVRFRCAREDATTDRFV